MPSAWYSGDRALTTWDGWLWIHSAPCVTARTNACTVSGCWLTIDDVVDTRSESASDTGGTLSSSMRAVPAWVVTGGAFTIPSTWPDLSSEIWTLLLGSVSTVTSPPAPVVSPYWCRTACRMMYE